MEHCNHIDFDNALDKAQAIRSALPSKLEKEKHGRQSYFRIGSGFDCETTITPKRYAYVYIWQFSINSTVFTGRSCGSFEEFLKILDGTLQLLHRKKVHGKIKNYPRLLVFDANMGYEWAFFKSVFGRVGIKALFSKDERHPLSISVGECLQFRECLGVFGYSLENVAEMHTKTQKLVEIGRASCRERV